MEMILEQKDAIFCSIQQKDVCASRKTPITTETSTDC